MKYGERNFDVGFLVWDDRTEHEETHSSFCKLASVNPCWLSIPGAQFEMASALKEAFHAEGFH